MKSPRILVVAVLLAVLAVVPALAGTAYKVDPVHTSLEFTISHMGVSCVWGRFNTVEGTYVLDDRNDAGNTCSITVDAASVDTHVAKRDEHLRSEHFFNVAKFPRITFVSKSLKKLGPKKGKITGDLTLLGVTKTISAPVTMTGEGPDPWSGYRTGFSTEFTINRSDFGMMTDLPKMLGDTVHLTMCMEGVRPLEAPPAALTPWKKGKPGK